MLAEDEVIGRRELLAVAAYGVLELGADVALVAEGEEIHDHLAIGSLHITHTLTQRHKIVLRDAVLAILHKDMISIAGTAHKASRDRDIGIGNGYTYLLLGTCTRTMQCLGYGLAVVHHAGRDSRNGLCYHRFDIDCAALGHRTYGNDQLGRTDINGYDIIFSTIHNILFLFISYTPPVRDTPPRLS